MTESNEVVVNADEQPAASPPQARRCGRREAVWLAATVLLLALLAANLGVYGSAQYLRAQAELAPPSSPRGAPARAGDSPADDAAQTTASGRPPQPAADQGVHGEPDTARPWYHVPEWWTATFTFLLFVATAGLWLFTARLWRDAIQATRQATKAADAAAGQVVESRRAADEMRNVAVAMSQSAVAAEKNAAAAEQSAQASLEQADAAKQQISIVERPYLFPVWTHNLEQALLRISPTRIYSSADVGRLSLEPMITFQVHNYGRTPALLRSIGAELSRVDDGSVPHGADLTPISIALASVIRPGDATPRLQARLHPLNLRMTQRDYEAFVSGRSTWWFVLGIEFVDLWGRGVQRLYKWRFDSRTGTFEAYAVGDVAEQSAQITSVATPIAPNPPGPGPAAPG